MKRTLFFGVIISMTVLLTAWGNAQDKAQGKWINDKEGVVVKIDGDDLTANVGGLVVEGEIVDVDDDELTVKVNTDDDKYKIQVKDDNLYIDGVKLKKDE